MKPDGATITIAVDVTALLTLITEHVEAIRERERVGSPWLSIDGAATYLGCSAERVRKLVQRRAIPFHQERPGARVFLNTHELDRWLLAK